MERKPPLGLAVVDLMACKREATLDVYRSWDLGKAGARTDCNSLLACWRGQGKSGRDMCGFRVQAD